MCFLRMKSGKLRTLMLLEVHFLWVFALSVQGHSQGEIEDHKNGESELLVNYCIFEVLYLFS